MWIFEWVSTQAVHIAFALNIVLFLSGLTTLLSILVLHKQHQRDSRIQNELFTRWRPMVAQYLTGEPLAASLKRDARRHPHWFLEMTMRQALLLRGHAFDRLQSLLVTTGIYHWLHKRLESRRPAVVAEAARALAVFRDEQSRPRLRQLLESPDLAVAFSAALALARVPQTADLEALFDMLDRQRHQHPDLVSLVLVASAQANPGQFAEFVRHYPIPSDELKSLVIEVVGHVKVEGLEDLLRMEVTQPSSPEGHLKALRALGEIGAADSVDLLRRELVSDRWEARAIAAWAVGQIQDDDSRPILSRLLADQHWSVRLNAAGALVALGRKGLEELAHAAESAEDPFARDVATHAIGRSRYTVPIL